MRVTRDLQDTAVALSSLEDFWCFLDDGTIVVDCIVRMQEEEGSGAFGVASIKAERPNLITSSH